MWTIGNNANGGLGNGTLVNSKIPVQVHIDEDTILMRERQRDYLLDILKEVSE